MRLKFCEELKLKPKIYYKIKENVDLIILVKIKSSLGKEKKYKN